MNTSTIEHIIACAKLVNTMIMEEDDEGDDKHDGDGNDDGNETG